MKLRRRNHPNRQGQKSPPGNAPQGKRTLAKIMTANTNEWVNHAGEVVNNAQIQAKVEEATKRNLAAKKAHCEAGEVPARGRA